MYIPLEFLTRHRRYALNNVLIWIAAKKVSSSMSPPPFLAPAPPRCILTPSPARSQNMRLFTILYFLLPSALSANLGAFNVTLDEDNSTTVFDNVDDFLSFFFDRANITKATGPGVIVDEDTIQSGDFFAAIRFFDDSAVWDMDIFSAVLPPVLAAAVDLLAALAVFIVVEITSLYVAFRKEV